MKRAGRIVHRLLTALSLLLLLATAGVWVRSYWVSDQLSWYDWPQDRSELDQKDICCSRGGIRLQASRYLSGDIDTSDNVHFRHDRSPATEYAAFGDGLDGRFAPKPQRYAALGFEWIPQSVGKWGASPPINSVFRSLTLPLYFPCLLFAILPAHYFLRLRHRRRIARRIAQGCCIGCGYDLRATPERCPECGRTGPSAPA